ncbi:cytochrome c oxidase subunit VIa [Ophiocordyceps camponoti-floridani]|uniref:Cytochrome c oxidase subunit n=1 Tax=Ophiocordyceps camponoti-floridani TaxID=2030778 RepID=A0A8H4Q2X3_9HYPO|nr:cytochrome c oxidase subunit VIa [Ophiocordyceps camponoti-floridani]
MSAARAASRLTGQLRFLSQRRFASSEKGIKFAENKFINERLHIKEHAEQSVELWKKLSLAVVPALLLAGGNAYYLWKQHWEHWEHMPPLEERTEYPYQNIRTKNFPWGDGDKTLFWNSEVNYHNKNK